jgi:hypothetical protein
VTLLLARILHVVTEVGSGSGNNRTYLWTAAMTSLETNTSDHGPKSRLRRRRMIKICNAASLTSMTSKLEKLSDVGASVKS